MKSLRLIIQISVFLVVVVFVLAIILHPIDQWRRKLVLSSSGGWDGGFLAHPSVVYCDSKYWLYYHGAINDENRFWRMIGLATSSDGYNFIKEASNPILERGFQSWDSWHVMSPAVLYYNGYFWLYYAGTQPHYEDARPRIGLAKSTDGINFIRITNGIEETSKVVDVGLSGEWDENGVSPCCVLFHNEQFMLYYWSGRGKPTHVAIGLATSVDGVNFVKIKDGIDGTSKVLEENVTSWWEDVGVHGASVFYDEGKYCMYYSGVTLTSVKEGKQMNIGYAESDDGKNWIRNSNNPILQVGNDDWENDYLVSCSFVQISEVEGLLYYQGAYTQTAPTNRIGVCRVNGGEREG